MTNKIWELPFLWLMNKRLDYDTNGENEDINIEIQVDCVLIIISRFSFIFEDDINCLSLFVNYFFVLLISTNSNFVWVIPHEHIPLVKCFLLTSLSFNSINVYIHSNKILEVLNFSPTYWIRKKKCWFYVDFFIFFIHKVIVDFLFLKLFKHNLVDKTLITI